MRERRIQLHRFTLNQMSKPRDERSARSMRDHLRILMMTGEKEKHKAKGENKK